MKRILMFIPKTWNMPRGQFGDYYFAIPDENFLHLVDINGRGVPGAKIEIFQRGAKVDEKAKLQQDQGVTWYPLIEDGDFYGPGLTTKPVIVGTTNENGIMRLPNRDTKECITITGFHRKANPFGNINVVGNRGLMLAKITKDNEIGYYWIEATEFIIGYARGQTKSFIKTIVTPYGSIDSPNPPTNVKWQYTNDSKKQVKVTWDFPKYRDVHHLERYVAFRVYRRDGTMGMNDRPWYPVATVNNTKNECIIDLDSTKVEDVDYYALTLRIGVTSVGEQGIQSGIVQGTPPQQQ